MWVAAEDVSVGVLGQGCVGDCGAGGVGVRVAGEQVEVWDKVEWLAVGQGSACCGYLLCM